MNDFFERKSPAHRSLDDFHNRSNMVFVTVCTKNRRPLLDFPIAHDLLIKVWSDSSQWMVGRYMIMPDHIHLFCSPATHEPMNVRDWISYWKSCVSRQWPNPEDKPIWQRDGWDRQLRSGESYSEKWAYVENNPVRAGLVANADEWPYQGELNMLRWQE